MGYKKFILPLILCVTLLLFVLKYPKYPKSEGMFVDAYKKDAHSVTLRGFDLKDDSVDISTVLHGNKNKVYKMSPMPYNYSVVPNVVHFVWFTKHRRPLEFTEMVSILSAHKFQKPDVIYLHCNIEPVGNWWLELNSKAAVKVQHRDIPMSVGSRNISNIRHATDVAKLNVLLEYGGGIVLDVDVIVLNSLAPLMLYNFTMGKEKAPKLSSGIIVSRGDSEFLHRWYGSYQEDYKSHLPDYNCCTAPYKIAQRHVDLIHIEATKLTTPDWMDKHLLYVFSNNNLVISWREFYVVHLMFHSAEGRIYNPEYIKALRNLVGKILRFVYFGSEDEISEFVPWVYYSKHPIIYDDNNTSIKPEVI